MVVALREEGFDAEKVRDDAEPGAWVVRVPGAVEVEATRALHQRGYPRPVAEGFASYYPSEGLVPTSSEEHVLLQYATAQELRRGLLTLHGVVDAHVNLVLPPPSRRIRGAAEAPGPRASVVVRFREDHPGIPNEEIARYVAGGVQGLLPEAVTVLRTRQPSAQLTTPSIVSLGPLSVPQASKVAMQTVFLLMLGLILGLAGALAFVVTRRRP